MVCFSEYGYSIPEIPVLLHLAGLEPRNPSKEVTAHAKVYSYPAVKSGFVVPGHADYVAASAGVAHSRSLAFLKKHLDGPWFDLEKIWDEHTFYEFEERSVEKTMATMVQEPYVNHTTTVLPYPRSVIYYQLQITY